MTSLGYWYRPHSAMLRINSGKNLKDFSSRLIGIRSDTKEIFEPCPLSLTPHPSPLTPHPLPLISIDMNI